MIYNMSVPELKKALAHNFEMKCNNDKGWSFSRGDQHIWQIKNGFQTARLINGSYQDHLKCREFSNAITRNWSA